MLKKGLNAAALSYCRRGEGNRSTLDRLCAEQILNMFQFRAKYANVVNPSPFGIKKKNVISKCFINIFHN